MTRTFWPRKKQAINRKNTIFIKSTAGQSYPCVRPSGASVDKVEVIITEAVLTEVRACLPVVIPF